MHIHTLVSLCVYIKYLPTLSLICQIVLSLNVGVMKIIDPDFVISGVFVLKERRG